MTNNNYNGALRLEALSIPQTTTEQLSEIKKSLKNCGITAEMCQDFNQIIVTGSGDCLAVVKAAMPVLNKYLGRFGTDIKFGTPLELSRYDCLVRNDRNDVSPENTLVIVISFSGDSDRLLELVKRSHCIGCRTIVITGNAQSPVAQESDFVLELHHSKSLTRSPGCHSYLSLLLGTILLAAYMSERRGTISAKSADDLCDNITAYSSKYQDMMESLDNFLLSVACKWKDVERFECIADGIAGSSASYCCTAKIIESFGAFCTPVTTSNWQLENIHANEPEKIASIIFADANENNGDKIRETVEMCMQSGRKVLLCCNAPATFWEISANIDICQLPATPKEYEFLYPVFNFIPGCLLSSYLTELHGETYFRNYNR